MVMHDTRPSVLIRILLSALPVHVLAVVQAGADEASDCVSWLVHSGR
jgi:hypothetical protein